MLSLLRSNRNFLFQKQFHSFVSVSEREILTNIPYNFNGVQAEVNQVHTMRMYQFLHQILGDKLENGFKYAIDAMIEGLESKDSEFFKEITEPKLYDAIERAFEFCERREIQMKLLNGDNQKQNIAFSNAGIHVGPHFDRQRNPTLNKKSISILQYMTFNIYTSGFMSSFMSHAPIPILQVEMYYSTPKKLVLENKYGQVIAGDDSNANQTHKIVFETDQSQVKFENSQLFELIKPITSKQRFEEGKKPNGKFLILITSSKGTHLDNDCVTVLLPLCLTDYASFKNSFLKRQKKDSLQYFGLIEREI